MAPNDESMHSKQEDSVEDNVPQQRAKTDDGISKLIKIEPVSEEEKQDIHPGNPSKKRKVAMYLAYVGHDYQGMQRNPGAKTIEDELFQAIHKAGGISDSNADEKGFTKVHWMRAARTDKGVSAICQVVSLMMVIPDGIVARINAYLPSCIRAFGIHRVVKGFDARKACDRRRYEYILPAWMFDPAIKAVKVEAEQPESKDEAEPVNEDEGIDKKVEYRTAITDGNPEFEFDDGCMAKLTDILKQYEGTHNFHNFTIRQPSTSPQAKRFIIKFSCEGTFTIAGKPWVKLVVIGQSFMLHQIRKMVGMAFAEYKGVAPPGSLKLAMQARHRIIVPMAPDLGLFLDECYYEAYNERWGNLHGSLAADVYREQIQNFKDTQLYPAIAKRDEVEDINRHWIRSINEAYYKFTEWKATPPKGVAIQAKNAGLGKRNRDGRKEGNTSHNKKQQSQIIHAHFNAEYSE
eukprot:jgi/Picsp_1/5109/NSC_02472-R1_trna pseudouridine synthase a